jgi:hypothetical protein
VLRQLEDLYIPQDERTLHKLQRKAQELDQRVRGWADSVVRLLPKGLQMQEEELYILCLFLANQRRLNLELDAREPEPTFRTRLGRVLPFIAPAEEDTDVVRAIHRMVATRIESDIERACGFFCRDHNVPPISDPAIDWRVAIRFMAQSMHSVASRIDVRNYMNSPRRFELAVTARDLAGVVVEKRKSLLTSFSDQPA